MSATKTERSEVFLRGEALALALVALASCGGPQPGDESGAIGDVEGVRADLNASTPGKGAGLLWRWSSGQLDLHPDTLTTGYPDAALGVMAPLSDWQVAGTGDFNADGNGDI